MSTNKLPHLKLPSYYSRFYFWLIFTAGIFLLITNILFLPYAPFEGKNIGIFAFFVVLNVISEFTITRIPAGGALTASFSVILSLFLIQGSIFAIISSVIGATISSVFIQKRHWSVTLFNAALFTIIFTISGFAVQYLREAFNFPAENSEIIVSILAMAFTVTSIYMILSSIIVNIYIYLSTGIKPIDLLKDDRWEFAQLIILAPISVLGVYFYYSIGVFATLAAFFPAIITVYSIKSYINMNESNASLKALNEDLEQLYEVTKKISAHNRLKKLWITLSSETNSLIPYDRCLIYMIDQQNANLILESGDLMYAPQEKHDLLDDGPLQSCIAKRTTIVNNDFKAPSSYGAGWKQFRSIFAEPIVVDGEIRGVICLLAEEKDVFLYNHLKFLRLLLSSVENTIKTIELYLKTQHQALTDGLTGMFNQKYFKSQVESELSRAKINKYNTSLIMIDVDYFKKFNDTHGHLLGDMVLKDVSRIIRSFIKNTDVASRYGGEEFAILLPETDIDEACELGEKIRKKVLDEKFIGREKREVKLSVSVGVTCYGDEDNELSKEDFIDRADTALYRAKNEGRNQVYKAIQDLNREQLLIKNYSNANESLAKRKKSVFIFTLDKQARLDWLNIFEKFPKWFDSEENVHFKKINFEHNEFIIKNIKKRIENNGEKLENILSEEDINLNLLKKFNFPTDFYKLEMELEELEKSLFDYIATVKTNEIEKDYIRKSIISIFNRIYGMAIKYTSNHYQKIVEYHSSISNINSEIGSISTINGFYPSISRLASEIFGTKYAFIADLDESKRFFLIKSFYGVDIFSVSEDIANLEFPTDKFTSRLINYAKTIVLSEEEFKDTAIFYEMNKIKSHDFFASAKKSMIIPIVRENKQISGIIVCITDSEESFSDDEVKLAGEISKRVVKALKRIEKNLFQRDSYIEIIKATIDIYESKNYFSKDHSKNVSRLAGRISNSLDLTKEEENEVRTAAYLHDIGKIAFTDGQENDLSHPIIGARIVSISEELRRLAPSIRHHHENWDGSGYPDGLKGTNIPIYSRIIAIANNYENYRRNSQSDQEAIERMKQSNLFDPDICEKIKNRVFNS